MLVLPYLIGAGLIAVGAVFFLLYFLLDSREVLFMAVGCIGLGALILWGYHALIW